MMEIVNVSFVFIASDKPRIMISLQIRIFATYCWQHYSLDTRQCDQSAACFSLVHSHWSMNVKAWLSLVESFIVLKYFHCLGTPALEACYQLVLYGIRDLA